MVNAGNGGAGLVVDRLEPHLPFEFIKVHHEPDGRFPNGIPNPMIEENRAPTAAAIRAHGADFGLAWDGDFDRCFFFDEQRRVHRGLLHRRVCSPRCCCGASAAARWCTIRGSPGTPSRSSSPWAARRSQSKSGHAFIKQRMREVDGVYGGEMSAHHYFRRFAYCDSGMIPWLLMTQILSETGKPLSSLVGERIAAFPASGELNYRVPDSAAAMAAVESRYAAQALEVDRTDGQSYEFADWRFNLRTSNTEPLLRLNVEARGSEALMRERTREILEMLKSHGAVAADH